MLRIIGLGHRRQMGKDTVAHILNDCITVGSGDVKFIVGFADELKRVCGELFPGFPAVADMADQPELKNRTVETVGKTPRDIMIEVGNKLREVWSDIWIHKLKTSCDLESLKKSRSSAYVIIPDVRYPNEVEWIRSEGGILIKVDRPNNPIFDDIADSALKDYGDFDDYSISRKWQDYDIVNGGTIESLYKPVKGLLEHIQAKHWN